MIIYLHPSKSIQEFLFLPKILTDLSRFRKMNLKFFRAIVQQQISPNRTSE